MPKELPTPYYLMQTKNETQNNMEERNQHTQITLGGAPIGETQTQMYLGPKNSLAKCPHCGALVRTIVKYTTTTRTHNVAALCCSLCLCCIPYCMESTRNADHYCPKCTNYIGSYVK